MPLGQSAVLLDKLECWCTLPVGEVKSPTCFGSHGTNPGQFNRPPHKVTIDEAGYLYVTDTFRFVYSKRLVSLFAGLSQACVICDQCQSYSRKPTRYFWCTGVCDMRYYFSGRACRPIEFKCGRSRSRTLGALVPCQSKVSSE